jgi:hypothetical protein
VHVAFLLPRHLEMNYLCTLINPNDHLLPPGSVRLVCLFRSLRANVGSV